MALDSSQLQVAGNLDIYVAPVGTTAPADVTAAWGAGWIHLGYTTEDGTSFTDSKDVNNIRAHQSFYPIDRRVEGRDAQIGFTLMQWNDDNVKLAFGGGTVSTVSAGLFKYVPPAPETLDFRAIGVETRDGAVTYRYLMPKGMVSENVETNMVRSDSSNLPIVFGLVSTGSGDPWYFLSNDPAMNPA